MLAFAGAAKEQAYQGALTLAALGLLRAASPTAGQALGAFCLLPARLAARPGAAALPLSGGWAWGVGPLLHPVQVCVWTVSAAKSQAQLLPTSPVPASPPPAQTIQTGKYLQSS